MANEKELTELYSGPGAESFRGFEDENGRVRATMGPGEIVTAAPKGAEIEMSEGYWCVVCGRYLYADEHGVILHDETEHPADMTFDDEDYLQ